MHSIDPPTTVVSSAQEIVNAWEAIRLKSSTLEDSRPSITGRESDAQSR
jgi:hypothetical protein